MVGAFPGRREERVHDLPSAVVVVRHEVRVSGKDNFLRVAKVGGDLGQAEPFRQPRRGGSVPQHVTAVLPSPLWVNAGSPPSGLPQAVRVSFEFLLEREPATSILRKFSLDVISQYFPDYPAQICDRLGQQ